MPELSDGEAGRRWGWEVSRRPIELGRARSGPPSPPAQARRRQHKIDLSLPFRPWSTRGSPENPRRRRGALAAVCISLPFAFGTLWGRWRPRRWEQSRRYAGPRRVERRYPARNDGRPLPSPRPSPPPAPPAPPQAKGDPCEACAERRDPASRRACGTTCASRGCLRRPDRATSEQVDALLARCRTARPTPGTVLALPGDAGRFDAGRFDAGRFVESIAWAWRPVGDGTAAAAPPPRTVLEPEHRARLEREGPPWLRGLIERWRSGDDPGEGGAPPDASPRTPPDAPARARRVGGRRPAVGVARPDRGGAARGPPAERRENDEDNARIDALLAAPFTSRPSPGTLLPLPGRDGGPPRTFDAGQFVTGVALNWRRHGYDYRIPKSLSSRQMGRLEAEGPPWLRAEIGRWRAGPCAACAALPRATLRSRCGGRQAPATCPLRPADAALDDKIDALFRGCPERRPLRGRTLPLPGRPVRFFDAHKFVERVALNWYPPESGREVAPSHRLSRAQRGRMEGGPGWVRGLVRQWRSGPCGACRAHPSRVVRGRCGVRHLCQRTCLLRVVESEEESGGATGGGATGKRARAEGDDAGGGAAGPAGPPALRPRPAPPGRAPAAAAAPVPDRERPSPRPLRRSARLRDEAVRAVPPSAVLGRGGGVGPRGGGAGAGGRADGVADAAAGPPPRPATLGAATLLAAAGLLTDRAVAPDRGARRGERG